MFINFPKFSQTFLRKQAVKKQIILKTFLENSNTPHSDWEISSGNSVKIYLTDEENKNSYIE